MKISVVCMGKGSTVKSINGGDVVVYHVDFAVIRERNPEDQKVFGGLHLESQEPFEYQEKGEYSIDLSEPITIVDPKDAKKAGIIH